MHETTEFTGNKTSPQPDGKDGAMSHFERSVPKIETSDSDLPSQNMYSMHVGDNGASCSGSNLRSSFIGMGFSQSLVNKVIEEKGEDDVDLLLETLFAYSALEKPLRGSSDSLDGLFSDSKIETPAEGHPKRVLDKPHSESSDSLDSWFGDDKDTSCSPDIGGQIRPKEDPDVLDGVNDDRRASLLMMNFSPDEINFAMDKLGEDAPINEVVDFIFAAQIAENQAKDNDDPNQGNEERNKEASAETMFGTMDKPLRLLEMGFSERQISAAIEKYGSEVTIAELADSICADAVAGTSHDRSKHLLTSLSSRSFDPIRVKTKEFSPGASSQHRNIDLNNDRKKRPKEEHPDDLSSLRRPKKEGKEDSSSFVGPTWLEAEKGDSKFSSFQMPVPSRELGRKAGQTNGFVMPNLSKPESCKSIDKMVAEAPYFFYGNVMNLSQVCWMKISQFLYALEPEFVSTQLFSALSRKEGYIHNIPSGSRFHILPKPPMTIEEAIPHAKKWWPSWDTRRQLSCINSEISGISHLCDRLGKILIDCRGLPSVGQQEDILHQCRTLNLVWIGRHKLAPIEPEQLEQIMGYPLHHTRDSNFGVKERLESLKHSFQTDTLGYHLSTLKSLFTGGLSLLSIYSGIGGAEISLHRLGIHLKSVVSVEPCEMKRKILKKWWQNSGQTGELVQIENIQRLASSRLEELVKKHGGFDFIICQNPYTYSSKAPPIAADADGPGGLDFMLFYEFVRVLQRVRSSMERIR